MLLSICESPEILSIMKYVKIVVDIIKVIVPIALIVAIMFSLVKVVTGKADEELPKALKASVNKVLAALLVFLIPTFIHIIFNTLEARSIDYASCLNNATDENIRIAYNKQAEAYVDIANETLLRGDYTYALEKVNNLKDEAEKQKLLAQLEEIEKKITEREEEEKKKYSVTMGGYVGDGFVYPLGSYKGSTSCCFGSVESLHPTGHSGLDIAAPAGTPIYAAKSGIVTSSQDRIAYGCDSCFTSGMDSCGNYVIINHQDGTETWYCHMTLGSVLVNKGQTVQQGQQIGAVGSTGHSTGNHLHFTVRQNGIYLNPANVLIYNAYDYAGCGIRTN